MQDRWYCRPDPDGPVVITRRPAGEGASPSQVVARMYDRDYALVMAHSPALLGALKWVRTLLAQEVCHCLPDVRECVVCTTDDLIAVVDQGAVP